MTEELTSFLDKAFSKRPDVFYVDEVIKEIIELPIPGHLKDRSSHIMDLRRSITNEYILERCDYFPDSRICIKYEPTDYLSRNVALIHPESTLYIFEDVGTFVELKEYNRRGRSIYINTNNVAQINTETGGAGSQVSTIYLTKKLES